MGFLQEFKAFAMKGNIMDLAVGVVIGGAFGKIVSSLVADIIMPPVGILLGNVNFVNLKVTLKDAVGTVPAVTLNYGQFIQNLVDFLIIAFTVFIAIKFITKLQRTKPVAPATPPEPTNSEKLLVEIRDLIAKK